MSAPVITPLNEFITLQRGFDLPEEQRKPGSIPVVASRSIVGFHSEKRVEAPGVVIGRSGSIGGGQYLDEPFWPLNTTLWVKDFKGHNPRYVYYLLKSIDFTSFNVGAGVPTLNRNHLAGIKVKNISHDQEIKIANTIAKYDDLIENNKRRIALLEESARLLYREWFVHFRFPGHEHVKIISGLPEGWSELKIEEVGEVVTGKTPLTKKSNYYGGLIPFVKTPDMHGNVYVLNTDQTLTEEGAATQANKFIPKDSLIVSCIGTLGVVAISATDCQTNQQINSVVPFDSNHNLYLYFTFKMLKPRLEAMGGGATMGNVNKSKFSSLNIVMPSGFLLNAFKDFADPVFQQILILQKQNQKLTQARDILLPRLMNGDLAV
ncbi:MAG: restriction endonuclease subunit S [Methyloprofundus sp.]|nr:restriction endonuclease subunit S [Methyloprofundus sp.]